MGTTNIDSELRSLTSLTPDPTTLPELSTTPAPEKTKKPKKPRPPEHNPKVFRHIPDSPVGSHWEFLWQCCDAGVHAQVRGGIHGNQNDGAFSVVLSGGYTDDVDEGDTIIYTGQGGQAKGRTAIQRVLPKTPLNPKQIEDQQWIRGNTALQISVETGHPVRVIRGHKLRSKYAPIEKGYRYDGLYRVTKYARGPGQSGSLICRFVLERLPGQPPIPVRDEVYDSDFVDDDTLEINSDSDADLPASRQRGTRKGSRSHVRDRDRRIKSKHDSNYDSEHDFEHDSEHESEHDSEHDSNSDSEHDSDSDSDSDSQSSLERSPRPSTSAYKLDQYDKDDKRRALSLLYIARQRRMIKKLERTRKMGCEI